MVDALNRRDEVADIYIENGSIADPSRCGAGVPEIDAQGLIVAPGLIDLHVHFREPGDEEAETIESGARAAARGGFTTVVTMPNTRPAIDNAERLRAVSGTDATPVRVRPAGCITVAREGRQVADLRGMAEAGAVAFTDDGTTPTDLAVLRGAMELAAELHRPVLDHALDPRLAGRGVIHEGVASARLRLPGIPAMAEVAAVERDIALAKETGCAIHIQHVSAAESVVLLRAARAKGVRITAEATPHHLALTDDDIPGNDANFKMNPPIRSEDDRQALLAGVQDGTLQVLATDHAPHRQKDKARGLISAPFGIVGLETAVGVTYSVLVESGLIPLVEWLRRWTVGPALALGVPPPSLAAGQQADLCLLDVREPWVIDKGAFLSKSRNTPFEGRRVTGRPVLTLCGGRLTWDGRGARA